MAGLISPKPVYSQNMSSQYNIYQRGLSAGYSDTPPIVSAPLAHPVPHQAVGQYMGNTLGTSLEAHEDGKIYSLVINLMDPATRESALLELSKKREQYDDLALVLWHSFGTHNFIRTG
jgi:CCR4-NOT transcription complex subunit 9